MRPRKCQHQMAECMSEAGRKYWRQQGAIARNPESPALLEGVGGADAWRMWPLVRGEKRVRALHVKRHRRAVISQPSRCFQSYAGTRAMHSSAPCLKSRQNPFLEDKVTSLNGKKASCPHVGRDIYFKKL